MELRTVIVGTNYRPIEAQDRFNRIGAGEELTLVREPTNQYDDNAIAVHTDDGFHVGYIPKTQNTALATALDEGRFFTATFDPTIERLYIVEVADDFA